jgi:hypothetical protein
MASIETPSVLLLVPFATSSPSIYVMYSIGAVFTMSMISLAK